MKTSFQSHTRLRYSSWFLTCLFCLATVYLYKNCSIPCKSRVINEKLIGQMKVIEIGPKEVLKFPAKYIIRKFAKAGENWQQLAKDSKVILCTQTDRTKLFYLAKIVKTWSGPISVATLILGSDEELNHLLIGYLEFCYPPIKE